ncbi:MAG: AMP-binding protein [Litoreibacter sp.]
MIAPSRTPINGLSHVRGLTDDPLLECTVPQLLGQTATLVPDNDAAVFCNEGIRWSYREFAKEVDRVATGLLSVGIAKGDRVGIWSPNRSEWLLTQFATARIGAVLVCINPAYRKAELLVALNAVECKLLVTATAFRGSDYLAMLRDLAPEISRQDPYDLNLHTLPHLRMIATMGSEKHLGMMPFYELRSEPDPTLLDAISLDIHDPINIQFTSGTTGSPKGACLTHYNIVNNAHFVTKTMNFTKDDRLCIPVPFYHCFGMVMGTLGCVSKGTAMVIPGEGFEPEQTLKAVSDERCTALFGVPTMFVAELALPNFESFDLTHLRTGIMAGAPCPREIMRKVQAQMNMKEVTIAYGMTETSPVSFQSNVDDPLEQRVSSVGRIHPHVEVKIIDDDGQIVPVGRQGELVTNGYSVMQGYWGDVEKTRDSIIDGWMYTGDLAVMDVEGYVAITGRVKDMIIRGGENIYPREIEEFLYTLKGVAQAQVFGISDDRFGEIVCAWIVPSQNTRLDENDVRSFCKDNVAGFKVPVHVRIKEELPMTVSGKPQKFLMRAEMEKELGIKNV